jgi:hypothetical protein
MKLAEMPETDVRGCAMRATPDFGPGPDCATAARQSACGQGPGGGRHAIAGTDSHCSYRPPHDVWAVSDS